ncbi:hypothetical protein JTB14_018577 [Gonioctena quinquepunctata]|nr:hypothetical protein JTB14_018577 [Gonioctena quinquepunctata]
MTWKHGLNQIEKRIKHSGLHTSKYAKEAFARVEYVSRLKLQEACSYAEVTSISSTFNKALVVDSISFF